jgi:hypothetical protein
VLAGNSERGCVVIQVPKGVTIKSVQFKYSMIGSLRVNWRASLSNAVTLSADAVAASRLLAALPQPGAEPRTE